MMGVYNIDNFKFQFIERFKPSPLGRVPPKGAGEVRCNAAFITALAQIRTAFMPLPSRLRRATFPKGEGIGCDKLQFIKKEASHMGREFELKYAANQAALEILKERYPDHRVISMETAYYDTPDGQLSRRRWTLRRRMENGASVCTLKTPLPDGSRGEWEVEAPQIEKGISDLCGCGAPLELAVVTAPGVVPVCGARFTRLAAAIALENCVVELALDSGALLGGGKELPFTEVEVELKSGDEAAAVAFAQALAAELNLKSEAKSKYRRALELAKGEV